MNGQDYETDFIKRDKAEIRENRRVEEEGKKKNIKESGKRKRRSIKAAQKKVEIEHAKENESKRGQEIKTVGTILVVIFGLMLLYFFYFEIEGKNTVLVNTLNNRINNMAKNVRKGDIMTSDGVIIATTQNQPDGTEYRYYPFDNVYAHTVGYESKGGAGLERKQDIKIKLLTAHEPFWKQIQMELFNQKIKGDTMLLTIDHVLQAYCYQQLAGRNGSIVVMEPSTGKILAMVSGPDFNPSTIDEDWNWLISDENTSGNMLNRCSQGRYAPGSTFKIITLLEYIREHPNDWQDFTYTCTGSYLADDAIINCHDGHAHGVVDIYGALSQSCNGAFITMGLELDAAKWEKLAEDFGYNQSFSLDVEYKKSNFTLNADASDWEKMQASIGQGTTVTSPLLNTMITCAVANGGLMMKPYLVEGFQNLEATYQEIVEPQVLKNSIRSNEADLLTEFMTKVVSEGSGAQAASKYAQVAGKTGSAQFSSTAGRYHAWFTGFAPAESPEIVVTVMIEDGGAGGEVAAPIAGNIFDYYFERKAMLQE